MAAWFGSAAAAVLAYVAVDYVVNKSGVPELHYKRTSFNKSIIERCPTLTHRYWPTPWMANRHLSTAFGTGLRSKPDCEFKREAIQVEDDGGVVYIDWMLPSGVVEADHHAHIQGDNVKIMMILSGLNGSSNEAYVRHLGLELMREGFTVVCFNNRGTGDSELKTPKSYSGANTRDLHHVLSAIRDRLPPSARMYAVGYSLGANILTKYIGEEGDDVLLCGAASVCNPFDFVATSFNLERWNRLVYNQVLTNGCVKNFERHRHWFEDHEHVDCDAVANVQRLREFDELFTARIFGYQSADEYYLDASSKHYLDGIRIPVLFLSPNDDPVVASTAYPRKECERNEHTIMAVTAAGGHLGFPTGLTSVGNYRNWSDIALGEFFKAVDTSLSE